MIQNLLSKQDQEKIVLGYKKRKVIVFSWVMFFALVLSGAVFIPILFLVQSKMNNLSQGEIANASAIKEQEEVLAFPEEINKLSEVVLSFKSKFRIVDKISKVQNSVPSNITLSAISFTPKTDKNSALNMVISGTAKDRNALIAFEKTLKGLDFVKSSSVPVNNFTKETDLSFTITLVLNSTQ